MAVQEAMSRGEFTQLASILDTEEAQTANDLKTWPAALHILGHIYNSNLEDARLLYKRLPAAVAQDPQTQAAHRLLQVLWQKDYQSLQGALSGGNWTLDLQPLVKAIEQKTRSDTLALLSRAYSHISAPKAAGLLGLSTSEVEQVARSEGWEFDPASNTYKVHHKSNAQQPLTNPDQIRRLTEFVVHLES